MRHHVEHLRSSAIAWEQLSPGVYRKTLTLGDQAGEITALFRFVPEEGASPPGTCHFHSVFEELFILNGKMTFDGKTWLGDRSYVFHPPYLVHGFKSAVPAETIFIARAPADLDFNFPEPPKVQAPFYVNNAASTRDFTYLNVPPEQEWDPIFGPNGQNIGRRCILSQDRVTGEGSSLIRLFEGADIAGRENGCETFDEGFIVEGRVEAETGVVWAAGDYWHRHAGKSVPPVRITASALIFSSVGGANPIT